MGRRILNEALRMIVNADRRNKGVAELRLISTVMCSFLNIMKTRVENKLIFVGKSRSCVLKTNGCRGCYEEIQAPDAVRGHGLIADQAAPSTTSSAIETEAKLFISHLDHEISYKDIEVIPIHLNVFRGDVSLLKQLLLSYKLPFFKKEPEQKQATDNKFQRLSYHAMCYCILHDEDVLSAIFSIWEGLRSANLWEEGAVTTLASFL
ncbi:hypothetical protein Droror1_Dr00023856 [Drosera rotundifolia]